MFRYFMELAYDGSSYCGWQIQPNAPSVQEELQNAFKLFLGKNIGITGAGRTDTGVNASFYVAHFDTETPLCRIDEFIYRLNRILPEAIAIYRIYAVIPLAHARFSAVSRTYKYYIGKSKNPFFSSYSYRVYPIPDIELMNTACRSLFKYSDFTSFSKLHTDTKTNLCRIMEAKWEDRGDRLEFTLTADRFLRNMVRAIVGTMLRIGQGKIDIEEFEKIIEAKNRGKAGISVPGNALFLTDIRYPEDILKPEEI